MLPKENRLKKREDFNNVFKKGKTTAGKLIFLKALKNNLNISRFGFVISVKISKKAVTRNKIKRQLREIIKRNLPNIKTGIDIVIISRPEIIAKKYQETKEEVEGLFFKAKLL